jgi:AbrB-like transcriptional regulator
VKQRKDVFFKMDIEIETAPLTGKVLLQKVKNLQHLSRREKARKCGYFSTTKNNQTRVNIGGFLNAIVEAQGIALSPEGNKDRRGRESTYRVSVHKNGQIVIGATYTLEMGLSTGDEFEIKLGYKHIHLVQVAEDNSEEA